MGAIQGLRIGARMAYGARHTVRTTLRRHNQHYETGCRARSRMIPNMVALGARAADLGASKTGQQSNGVGVVRRLKFGTIRWRRALFLCGFWPIRAPECVRIWQSEPESAPDPFVAFRFLSSCSSDRSPSTSTIHIPLLPRARQICCFFSTTHPKSSAPRLHNSLLLLCSRARP